MQLVKSLPILAPVQRSNGWFEDFTQTGAKTVGLVGGIQNEVTPTATGLRLEPVTTTYRSVSLPFSFSSRFSDFETEYTLRGYGSYTTSTDINLQFRWASNNDRMIVSKIGNNTLKLVRAKNGVYTALATVTNVPFTSRHRIGVRAIGPLIEVYLDGVKVIAVTETHNMRFPGPIILSVYDPSVNVARGEFGYLVVRSLGYNPFIVQDSFNRADSAVSAGTSDSGHTYTITGSGTLGISSNKLYAATATAGFYGIVNAAIADCIVNASITTHRNTSSNTGLALRTTNESNLSGRLSLLHESDANGTGQWALYQVVSSVATLIGSWAFTAEPNGRTWDVSVSMIGSAIIVSIDGTPRITVTNTTNQASVTHGFRFNTNDTSSRVDSFSIKRPN